MSCYTDTVFLWAVAIGLAMVTACYVLGKFAPKPREQWLEPPSWEVTHKGHAGEVKATCIARWGRYEGPSYWEARLLDSNGNLYTGKLERDGSYLLYDTRKGDTPEDWDSARRGLVDVLHEALKKSVRKYEAEERAL